MTSSAPTSQPGASARAAENLQANLAALQRTQPELVALVEAAEPPGTFLYARDGYLTARDADGRWSGGCSLPLRAGRELLETLHNRMPVACFLEPSHAAQLAVAMERLDSTQAVIAVVSDPRVLRFILCCQDFSPELAAHRLWFVAGEAWADQLAALLRSHEGLSMPASFIRLPLLSDEIAERELAIARELFGAETTRRSARAAAIKETWTLNHAVDARRDAAAPPARLCVVAPGRFRLWDDGGWLLGQTLCAASPRCVQFDPDAPLSGSPLAFAAAACACDGVVTAGVYRSDVPDVVPAALPWLTLATSARLPAPVPAATADRVLVTDLDQRARAIAAGWPEQRVVLVGWPAVPVPSARPDDPAGQPALTLIADTSSIQAPPDPLDLSSHQLLWELIRKEISENPFVVGTDISGYLDQRRQRLEISSEGLDRALFIDRLIVPAYVQSMARLLIRRNIGLVIYGAGWEDIEEASSAWRGPVAHRDQFLSIMTQAACLLHPWPLHGPHLIEAWQRPVVRAFQADETTLLAVARAALELTPTASQAPPLTADRLLELLAG